MKSATIGGLAVSLILLLAAGAPTATQGEAAEAPMAVRTDHDGKSTADTAVESNGSAEDDDYGWPGSWWVIMPIAMIGMIVFWAAVIGVGVWAVREITRTRRERKTALDIAKERYARGEINRDEFNRIRRDID